MTNEEIQKFKDRYKNLLGIKKELLSLEQKIKDYEENPVVKEYLELKKQLEIDMSYSYFGVQNLEEEEEILLKAVQDIGVKEINNIYTYIDTYKGINQLRKRVKNNNDLELADIPVPYNCEEADYRRYRNIELFNGDDQYEILVPISKCREFLKNNLVLHPYLEENAEEFYKDTKKHYFDTLYYKGEAYALERVEYRHNLEKNLVYRYYSNK